MIVKKTIPSVRSALTKTGGNRVLVPTMGGLHRGHRALIEKASRLAGDSGMVIVSIFVNPTQFGPKEDFSNYPRPFQADLALCQEAGATVVFAPEADGIYHADKSVAVSDLVITGEGSIDEQTLQGKGPYGVACRAKAGNIPVIGLAGSIPSDSNEKLNQYFDVLIAIASGHRSCPHDVAALARPDHPGARPWRLGAEASRSDGALL